VVMMEHFANTAACALGDFACTLRGAYADVLAGGRSAFADIAGGFHRVERDKVARSFPNPFGCRSSALGGSFADVPGTPAHFATRAAPMWLLLSGRLRCAGRLRRRLCLVALAAGIPAADGKCEDKERDRWLWECDWHSTTSEGWIQSVARGFPRKDTEFGPNSDGVALLAENQISESFVTRARLKPRCKCRKMSMGFSPCSPSFAILYLVLDLFRSLSIAMAEENRESRPSRCIWALRARSRRFLKAPAQRNSESAIVARAESLTALRVSSPRPVTGPRSKFICRSQAA